MRCVSSVTLEASGTQAATISTEHTLSTLTGQKVYTLFVDCAAMLDGDETELRVYYTTLSAGTERLMYPPLVVRNAPSSMVKQSLPIPSDISCKFTLKQTAGTGRSYPWKVLS